MCEGSLSINLLFECPRSFFFQNKGENKKLLCQDLVGFCVFVQ